MMEKNVQREGLALTIKAVFPNAASLRPAGAFATGPAPTNDRRPDNRARFGAPLYNERSLPVADRVDEDKLPDCNAPAHCLTPVPPHFDNVRRLHQGGRTPTACWQGLFLRPYFPAAPSMSFQNAPRRRQIPPLARKPNRFGNSHRDRKDS